MPCGWEGNRRSGDALAMRHRLQWLAPRAGDNRIVYATLHGFPRLFTVISEHICFLILVFLFLYFLVVGSVR